MKNQWPRILIYVCVFLLGFAAVNAAGYLFGWAPVSGLAAMEEVDKYEVRSYLLMQAMDAVGACTPEDAAGVWAKGVSGRSAALQYAAMTTELKKKYARDLESTFQNWVTGGSSPWVESWKIVENKKNSGDRYSMLLRFHMVTSAGPAGNYDARLDVVREGSFWRVAAVTTDRDFDAYTGFKQ